MAHDIFHKVVHDREPSPDFLYSRHSQGEATLRSWATPFIGTRSLKALEQRVEEVVSNELSYAPYCSIIQSSGTGKSRLVDEFSKYNFLIPINLRMEDDGFPPPDRAIRDVLTKNTKIGRGKEVYYRMLHFLFELFEKTSSIIVNDLKEATTASQRIIQFREFMTTGQKMAGVGEKRNNFYHEVAVAVETTQKTREISSQQVQGALEKLISHIGPLTTRTAKFPRIFIAFDEAHPLADLQTTESRTYLTELCSVLQHVGSNSFFCFFLSTTSKISRFAIPRDVAGSASLPFSDLGFDHMMHDRKIFSKFRTLDGAAATECVVYMGRPLWGTRYDSSGRQGRMSTLDFARMKLLRSEEYYRDLHFTAEQHCAILSQRLALDIDCSAYLTRSHTRDYQMLEKVQSQVAGHMRICVSIPEDPAFVCAIAASEPILSEAASTIMRLYPHFWLPDALLNVLDSYTINHGERGELLVSAFFTRARDLYVRPMREQLFPDNPTQFCPIFSVSDLLSNLFCPVHLCTILESFPSVRRADFSSERFRNVFENTKMHFNHMIRPVELKVISRLYLLRIMTRGAAVLGTNCEAGYDMIYPFLYGSSDLVIEKVGFIIVQVKNQQMYTKPDPDLFRKMDPVVCDLLKAADSRDFTVPIIRIVFALGVEEPSLNHMVYESPQLGATTFDEAGHPRFTSYDFWCSGLAPGLLQPVDEGGPAARMKWEELLRKTDKLHGVFSRTKAPDVRKSQYPGGGDDTGYYDAWMEDSE